MRQQLGMMKKGQMHTANVATCGECRKEHRFPLWTSRMAADEDIKYKMGWVRTQELGLVCPECFFKVFEEVTQVDLQRFSFGH